MRTRPWSATDTRSKGGTGPAFDQAGRIHKLSLEFDVDGGNSKDVTPHVLELAMLSAEGAYDIPGFQVKGVSYRTNRMTRTAMRTFGVIQCSLIRETAIEHVAHELPNLPPEEIRQRNFYADVGTPVTPYGQPLDYCIINEIWQQLREHSDFDERAQKVEHFNKTNRWHKRGIAMTPIKYGVAYTYLPYNQGTAYVAAYAEDGSVVIHTGAIEMGQGIYTKLIQLAAETLKIGIEKIEVAPPATEVIPNASSSGASVGADLHGGALEVACRTLRQRLESMCRDLEIDGQAPPCWSTREGWRKSWPEIVEKAYQLRLDLTAEAHYRSPDITGFDPLSTSNKPFLDFTWSAACSEVEIDVLTGEFNILRTDILV